MPDHELDKPLNRPTNVRFVILGLATLVAILLYLDRICVSTAAEAVREDLGISKPELDWVLSAFFWTYAAAQLPAGWLGDRYGARWMLGAYVALWSWCTAMMGFSSGATAILFWRLATGLFEAGAYPVAAGIVSRWINLPLRGIASSTIAIGGRLGGALAPIITIQLMLLWSDGEKAAPASWRPVMMLYGGVGMVIALVFVVFFRDSPENHPACNDAERRLIRGLQRSTSEEEKANHGFPPLWIMLTDSSLWLSSFVQFASNFGWAILVTKMPEYLREVYGVSQSTQGWLQSLPLLAGIGGLLLGGVATDLLRYAFGVRFGRASMLCCSRMMVAVSFFVCLMVDSPIEATLCLALVGFATDLGIPAVWALSQDIGGRHVGSILGWSNMWGNLGAALSPVLLGLLIGSYGQNVAQGWQTAFVACGILQIVAAIAAMGIRADRPIRSI